jgi:RNA polymerase sigma factor (sigma-70 family)
MQDLKLLSDEDLVQLYKRGEEHAFSELYSRYEKKIKRLIYYYIPDTDDACDVFHEAIIRVFRHIDTFNVAKSFSSWIYQIAINCSKNRIAQMQREIHLLEQERYRLSGEQAGQASPEDLIISENDMAEFNRSVENLKEKFRTVFILKHDQMMKYSEIAAVLKCSERTVKWRMKKALEKIAQHLAEKEII